MVKKSMILVAAVLMALGLKAQSVQETIVMVGTLTVPAYTVSFDKDAKLVQDAMNQRLKDLKLKTKKSEGYVAALEQVCTEISTAPLSLYTKVEEEGKKKERMAVLTVCAISNDLTIDQAALRSSVRQFAESMVGYIQRYEAAQQLAIEQENLKKAEKAASAATSAVNDLEKDITSGKKKISDKKSEIEKLKGKIKDLENDIKDLEKEIEKNNDKKSDAEKKAAEAEQTVKTQQAEVDRWQQMAN